MCMKYMKSCIEVQRGKVRAYDNADGGASIGDDNNDKRCSKPLTALTKLVDAAQSAVSRVWKEVIRDEGTFPCSAVVGVTCGGQKVDTCSSRTSEL